MPICQPISRSKVTLYWWMRGCFSPKGTQLAEIMPLNELSAPPVRGLVPCTKPGQPDSGAVSVARLVRPAWKELVASGSRMPCAAAVG